MMALGVGLGLALLAGTSEAITSDRGPASRPIRVQRQSGGAESSE